MSTFVLVVALGCLAASMAFFVAGRNARASSWLLFRQSRKALDDARALYGVGLMRGVIYCDGREFTVTSISTDSYVGSGAWFLTAETTKSLTERLTMTEESA